MDVESNILISRGFQSDTLAQELDTSLDNYLLDVIRHSADIVYMIDSNTNRQLTVSEYVRLSYNLAAELQSLGCKSGTLVGIISENRLEYPVVALGTILTGATITCFNPDYTTVELEHVMSISQPSVVFCSSKNYNKVKQTNQIISCVKHIILLDTEEVEAGTQMLFSNLTESWKKYKKITNRPDDTVAILYSSGTTGFPKGVMLSHRNFVFILKLMKDEKIIHFEGKVSVNTLPMFHTYGFFISLQTIVLGHTLIIMRKFNEEMFLSIIQKYKIQFLYLVPTLVIFLVKDEMVDRYDLSSVKHIICGAASLKKETEDDIVRKLNLKYLQQAYGMTESTLLMAIRDKRNLKAGTCGSAVPGIQLKIVDLETGRTLGVGEVGEICSKGPHIMKGYYRNTKETERTIDKQGWLHTGDVGYYDKDGDLFLVDRQKDLIKYKSFQVAPAELESYLLKHPLVYDAAVIGVPDEVAGEIPRAFIVKQKGSSVTENELVQFIAEMVSPQKRLRGGVIFTEEIPRNPSGKILRRKLREKVNKKLNSKY